MSKFTFALILFVTFSCTVLAAKYSCTKCISEGKNCGGNDKEPNSDYCVKLDGKIYDANMVDVMARTYLNNNHPNFQLRDGQHIFGRGGISKALLTSFGYDDSADCTNIERSDNTGFIGIACTCLGNC